MFELVGIPAGGMSDLCMSRAMGGEDDESGCEEAVDRSLGIRLMSKVPTASTHPQRTDIDTEVPFLYPCGSPPSLGRPWPSLDLLWASLGIKGVPAGMLQSGVNEAHSARTVCARFSQSCQSSE